MVSTQPTVRMKRCQLVLYRMDMKERTINVKDFQRITEDQDDKFIYCDSCNSKHRDGHCPINGPLVPLDESLGWDEPSQKFTHLPVPKQVRVKKSVIKGAGLGVFALELIPKGVRIGPYGGEKLDFILPGTDCSYLWEIKQNGKPSRYIDGKKLKTANWLRYVNCARSEDEQNLQAFQYCGNIYYRTIVSVLPGTELLTWYGMDYAIQNLGMTVDYTKPAYFCSTCKRSFVKESSYTLHFNYSVSCKVQRFNTKRQEKNGSGKNGNGSSKNGNSKNGNSKNGSARNGNGKGLSTINRHLQQVQLLSKQYMLHACNKCGKVFCYRSTYKRHMKTMHDGTLCQYCSKFFQSQSALRCHVLRKHCEKRYQCQICLHRFATIKLLQRHSQGHRKKLFQCEFCDLQYAKKGNLMDHVRLNHTHDKPYICSYCTNSFPTRRLYNAHMITKHHSKK